MYTDVFPSHRGRGSEKNGSVEMANLTFIPNAVSKGDPGLTLEDIPDEVRNDCEEVYAALKTNPGRMRVTFDSLAELNTYIAQVTAYCRLRPGGPIRFRKSPSRNLPPTTMDFRITDVRTENEAITDGIRSATNAVTEAAKAEVAKTLGNKPGNARK